MWRERIEEPEVLPCQREPLRGSRLIYAKTSGISLVYDLVSQVVTGTLYKEMSPSNNVLCEWNGHLAKRAHKYPVIFYQNCVVVENFLSTEIEE